MKQQKKHFVLIHGAWHNSRAFHACATYLRTAGHCVSVPTLPGHHPNDPQRGTVQFSDYVQAVEEAVIKTAQPAQQVILVGHSSAGFLMQAAAPRVADRIERLLFNNAWILGNGQSQFDLVLPDIANQMIDAARNAGDHCVPVSEEVVRHLLMPLDPPEQQDALLRLLVPQPLAIFTTPVDTCAFAALDLPKQVIFCRDDTSGPYLALAENLGIYDVMEIPGGHETLFTDPARFGQVLLTAVEASVSPTMVAA